MGPKETISCEHLQRWALGPRRWSRLIKAHARRTVEGHPSLVPRTTIKLNLAPLDDVAVDVSQVLGGQYIVTTVFDTRRMYLWDLGVAGQKPLDKATQLDCVEIGDGWYSSRMFQVGEFIRVVFSLRGRS